jgi:outer membrane receptor protein involved in Fe transport
VGASDILGIKFLMFDSDQTPSVSGVTGHPGYINWWKWLPQRDMGTGGDFPYIEAQKSNRQTYQADWSHYAEDFLGEHDMKFGVQYTAAEGNWLNGYFQNYANFAYTYGWNYSWQAAADWPWNTNAHWFNCETECWPMYNRVVEQYPGLTVRQADSTGAFFDDTWVLNDDFTLNLGLRYDQMTAKYGEGEIYDYFDEPSDINNPTVLRTRAGTDDIFDWKTWSPRIGMAWTVTDDKKTVLRAHLGRYYATMGVDSLRRFGPDAEPYLQNTWLYFLPPEVVDLNGNGWWDPEETPNAMRSLYGRTPDMLLGSTLTDPSYTLEVEPGTGSPYTDQFNVSFQRQLGSDIAVEFSYIYKKEQDLLALRPYDVGTGEFFEYEDLPFTTWTGYETSVWQIVPKDYNGDGVVDAGDWQYVATAGNVAYRVVNAQDFVGSDVDRTYTGLQLVLTKRYSNRWQMLAAVNWTKTDGSYPRTVDQNWYIDGPIVMDTPFGASRSDFQNNLEGPAGMTPEWMIKVSGSYTIPVIETDFGFRARYDSGRAFFPIQDIPIYFTWMGGSTSGVFLETGWRNMMVATDPNDPDWFPASTIFDFSLSKTFKLGDVGQLAISFDALNAFNEDAPNRAVYSSSNYGLVTSLVLPRTYRAGVKFSF